MNTTDQVNEPAELRLAMIGMLPGNGHPYSWSAIFNGYDEAEMAKCPYASIPVYLGKQPKETLRIPNTRVTHIWTDNPAEAPLVAAASLIPNIVQRPEDVIGQVDCVVLATDHGEQHVERARPFVEAGVPLFIDKPLVDNEADLRTFQKWVDNGAVIMSSSMGRYIKEFGPLRASTHDLGQVRFVSVTMSNVWERYAIHALEAIYPILGPGFLSVRNLGESGRDIAHIRHKCAADIVVAVVKGLERSAGVLQVCGTTGFSQVAMDDYYVPFRAQLEAFVGYARTGERPFPFAETVELMKLVIAGIRSREESGREVHLSEISER